MDFVQRSLAKRTKIDQIDALSATSPLLKGLVMHLIVKARAGTGKTFTLIEGMNRLFGKKTPGVKGTDQQELVWKHMKKHYRDAANVCFVAFNKSIATELASRVPKGASASTLHSMGLKVITSALGRCKINGYRTDNIIEDVLGVNIRDIRRQDPDLVSGAKRLVSLCKLTLCEPTTENLENLVDYYDITIGPKTETFDLVAKVMKKCLDVKGEIDFDDMIWLPVVKKLEATPYDLLMVDESQDLNRCQQELVMMMGTNLVMVGDDRQAIYGFAGADTGGMERMGEFLEEKGGCKVLPLTRTRRCARTIVKLASEIVPDFESMEGASDGVIDSVKVKDLIEIVSQGDMLLCRVNAPLVSWCFRLLKKGIKATIQGRDIGQGIIKLVKSLKAEDVTDLTGKLSDWYHTETMRENAKRNPSEARLIALDDKYQCLDAFCDGAESIQEVLDRIDTVFSDNGHDGVKLSSIHRAKGLESDHVFILNPELLPHPMASTDWGKEQETNLKYVAITRAKNHLSFVVK